MAIVNTRANKGLLMNSIKQSVHTKDFLSEEYVSDFCDSMLKFFDIDYYSTVEKEDKRRTYIDENGESKPVMTTVTMPNALPTIQGFARNIGVSSQKIFAWAEKYPEIKETLVRCQDIQYDILVNNALRGMYAASPAIFAQKNLLGFTDKINENPLIGGGNTNVTLNINSLLNKIADNNKDKGILDDK